MIHTHLTDPVKTPVISGFNDIPLDPGLYKECREGFLGIEDCSHLVLLYLLNQATPSPPHVNHLVQEESGALGNFVPWHISRPNHIGMSIMTMDLVPDTGLRYRGCDILNNTSLLDTKPYVRSFDSIDAASNGWVDPSHLSVIQHKGQGYAS